MTKTHETNGTRRARELCLIGHEATRYAVMVDHGYCTCGTAVSGYETDLVKHARQCAHVRSTTFGGTAAHWGEY